jgi:hypothetical protein
VPKGYSVPRTPTGKSSLVPPPPWHYAGDFLIAEFWARPEAVAATLPSHLRPDPEAEGHGQAFFIDWQFTADNDEYLDPARYRYSEFLILVDALFDDQKITWCPYIFVDNDSSLARGWIQGFPKRMGSIFQTRTFAAQGAASPQVAPGGKFAAVASTAGQRLAEARITLEKPSASPAAALVRPIMNMRYFPRLAAGYHDKPAVQELVISKLDNVRIEQCWIGTSELVFPECRGEELSDLSPVRCGAGTRMSISSSVNDVKTIVDVTIDAE